MNAESEMIMNDEYGEGFRLTYFFAFSTALRGLSNQIPVLQGVQLSIIKADGDPE